MKKAFIFTSLAYLTACLSVAFGQINLVWDAGFDLNPCSNHPQGWVIQTGEPRVVQDCSPAPWQTSNPYGSQVPASGSAYLSISTGDAMYTDIGGILPGQAVKLTVKASRPEMTASVDSLYFALWDATTGSTETLTYIRPSDCDTAFWTCFQVAIPAAQTGGRYLVLFAVGDNSAAWFIDDLQVTLVQPLGISEGIQDEKKPLRYLIAEGDGWKAYKQGKD